MLPPLLMPLKINLARKCGNARLTAIFFHTWHFLQPPHLDLDLNNIWSQFSKQFESRSPKGSLYTGCWPISSGIIAATAHENCIHKFRSSTDVEYFIAHVSTGRYSSANTISPSWSLIRSDVNSFLSLCSRRVKPGFCIWYRKIARWVFARIWRVPKRGRSLVRRNLWWLLRGLPRCSDSWVGEAPSKPTPGC